MFIYYLFLRKQKYFNQNSLLLINLIFFKIFRIFCCTLNKIPETNSLLQKSRLPLGILIHPFRDLSQLAVIQCSSIVRCRACR